MIEPQQFENLMHDLTQRIEGVPLDANLAAWLNREYPQGSAELKAIEQACHDGIAAGWICNREHAGIRYGRVIKPGPATHGFSVDVVDMNEIAGGHHVHPHGEIDLLLPVSGAPTFDGQGAGWCVYAPGTAHTPTVAGGRALVVYLLPQGAIEFTRT